MATPDFLRLEALVRQLQSHWLWGEGDPNGVKDGPMGATYQDSLTGDQYRKTSAAGTLTGWMLV